MTIFDRIKILAVIQPTLNKATKGNGGIFNLFNIGAIMDDF
jgi:hypothetical protein